MIGIYCIMLFNYFMKKVIFISFLLLAIVAQQPQRQGEWATDPIDQQQQNIPDSQQSQSISGKNSRTDRYLRDERNRERPSSMSEEDMQSIELIVLILSITFGTIFITASLALLFMCMKRRTKRKAIQEQMYLKQVELAASMGITIHQMNRMPERPKTIHI